MSACIIELNDIGLFTTVEAGLYAESPAYALLNGDEIIVGEAARAAARLHPRQINNRFWQQLGLNPLPEQSPQVRHHADLAYRHLLHVHQLASEPPQVIFAVPASFDRDQLAVLLGITQQCPFDAVGLVDLAVAAAAGLELPGSGVHIDLQLHQVVVTALNVAEGSVARAGERVAEGAGLLALYNQFSHLIADAFIQQCRFDPLHDAHSEQLLYDALPEWLQQQAQLQEFVFAIPQGDTVHTAKLPRAAFLGPVHGLQQRIRTCIDELGDNVQCTLVAQNLVKLPGFFELVEHGMAVPLGAVAEACRQHAELISSHDASLPFITRLPATSISQPTVSSDQQHNQPAAELAPNLTAASEMAAESGRQAQPLATHILLNSTAYALREAEQLYADDNGGLALAASKDKMARAGLLREQQQLWLLSEPSATLFVNDIAAQQKQPVAKGDRLSFTRGGPHALLIELNTSHGAQT